MTFKVLCERVGISDVALRKALKRNDCKLSDFVKISEVLGFSICEITGHEHENKMPLTTETWESMKAEIGYLKEIVRLKDELKTRQNGI